MTAPTPAQTPVPAMTLTHITSLEAAAVSLDEQRCDLLASDVREAARFIEATLSAPASLAPTRGTTPRFTTEQRDEGWTIYDGRRENFHGLNIGTVSDEFDAKALVELLNDLASRAASPSAQSAPATTLTRWAMRSADSVCEGDPLYDGMETDESGDWVRFEDVVRLCSLLGAPSPSDDTARLKAVVAIAKSYHDNECARRVLRVVGTAARTASPVSPKPATCPTCGSNVRGIRSSIIEFGKARSCFNDAWHGVSPKDQNGEKDD